MKKQLVYTYVQLVIKIISRLKRKKLIVHSKKARD